MGKEVKLAIGTALRALRQADGKSQTEVAKETGLSQPLLSMYESGTKTPSLLTAHRLTSFYGASLSSLVDGNELEKAKQAIRGED